MQLTGGEAVIRSFQAAGGRFAFGIASGKLTPVMAALSRANAPRFIGVRHEGSASLMAAGSMAGTGQIALALGELGPGGGNLVSGVASAFSNNLPLLALTSGNVLAASRPTRGQLMDIDLESLFRPITESALRRVNLRKVSKGALVSATLRCRSSGRTSATDAGRKVSDRYSVCARSMITNSRMCMCMCMCMRASRAVRMLFGT